MSAPIITCREDLDALTEEQALEWLIANDREGADFWRSFAEEFKCGFTYAVKENIRDFGYQTHDGEPLPNRRTSMKKHKHAEVIKAWADGAEVQVNFPNDGEGWMDADNPLFYETAEYRIKPEPNPNLVVSVMMKFKEKWHQPFVHCSWSGDCPAGYQHNLSNKDLHCIKFTFDGETEKVIKVELA